MTDKLVCPSCHSIVVTPFTPKGWDGTTPSVYRCNSCQYTAEGNKFKHITKSGPLGSVDIHYLSRPGKFDVIERRRTHTSNRSRSTSSGDRTLTRNDNRFTPTEPPIPKLANMIDSDLQALVKDRPAIITSIQDELPMEDN